MKKISRGALFASAVVAGLVLVLAIVGAQPDRTFTFARPAEAAITPANPEGWASQTGFRRAETNIQKNLVSSVTGLGGQSSGQSIPRADVRGGDWDVDTDGGDGQRMRNGIQDYDKWYWARGAKISKSQIRAQMIKDMGTTYTDAQKGLIGDQIIAQYDMRAARGPFVIPTNDRDTLAFLAIRKQCREFVSSKVLGVGGTPRAYNTGKVTNPASYRPGMGLYKGTSHAMIIIDIYWDKNGNPISFKVAEANNGAGWSKNPPGQVPWLRTVRVGDREIKASDAYFNDCYVVSFG